MWNHFFDTLNEHVNQISGHDYDPYDIGLTLPLENFFYVPLQIRKPTAKPRILLVDDDASFCKIMEQTARLHDIMLSSCTSSDEFINFKTMDFEVVLMDYDLGAVTGIELSEFMETNFAAETPVILLSQSTKASSKIWPHSICWFIHKDEGPNAILNLTSDLYQSFRSEPSKIKGRHWIKQFLKGDLA